MAFSRASTPPSWRPRRRTCPPPARVSSPRTRARARSESAWRRSRWRTRRITAARSAAPLHRARLREAHLRRDHVRRDPRPELRGRHPLRLPPPREGRRPRRQGGQGRGEPPGQRPARPPPRASTTSTRDAPRTTPAARVSPSGARCSPSATVSPPSSASATTRMPRGFTAVCQRAGLVPIVEPEILTDGDHDIHACAAVTERVLARVFAALHEHRVDGGHDPQAQHGRRENQAPGASPSTTSREPRSPRWDASFPRAFPASSSYPADRARRTRRNTSRR